MIEHNMNLKINYQIWIWIPIWIFLNQYFIFWKKFQFFGLIKHEMKKDFHFIFILKILYQINWITKLPKKIQFNLNDDHLYKFCNLFSFMNLTFEFLIQKVLKPNSNSDWFDQINDCFIDFLSSIKVLIEKRSIKRKSKESFY